MIAELPTKLTYGRNAPVFEYLRGKSAHSDIVSVLSDAVEDLPDVHGYCPDLRNYGYVVFCVNDVVFGFAEGMQGVTLRLPETIAAGVMGRGGEPRPAVGPDWVFLELFADGGFEAELKTLVRESVAYIVRPVGS